MQGLRERVQQFAQHEGSVLISGEPGTGRTAFARYMHGLSRRADEPLISITAASLTQSNAEEQLCGREAGGEITAGAFERAARGTLVIDDLADLNEAAQRLLLATLEDGVYQAVQPNAENRLPQPVLLPEQDINVSK